MDVRAYVLHDSSAGDDSPSLGSLTEQEHAVTPRHPASPIASGPVTDDPYALGSLFDRIEIATAPNELVRVPGNKDGATCLHTAPHFLGAMPDRSGSQRSDHSVDIWRFGSSEPINQDT